METNLAFSMGKTFGHIDKIMKNIDNINFKQKKELDDLFSNLLNDIKKFNSKTSTEEIEQKTRDFSLIHDIEKSKMLANEIYVLFNEFMENIYSKLKYNV